MSRDSTPSDMHEREMIDRMIEGYKIAISCMREMQPLQPYERWDLLIPKVEELLYLAKKLLNAKGQSRQKLLAGVEEVEYNIAKAINK